MYDGDSSEMAGVAARDLSLPGVGSDAGDDELTLRLLPGLPPQEGMMNGPPQSRVPLGELETSQHRICAPSMEIVVFCMGTGWVMSAVHPKVTTVTHFVSCVECRYP